MGCIVDTSPAEARWVAASDSKSRLQAGAGLGAIRESGDNVATTDMASDPKCGCDGVCCGMPSISVSPWLFVGLDCVFAADDLLR